MIILKPMETSVLLLAQLAGWSWVGPWASLGLHFILPTQGWSTWQSCTRNLEGSFKLHTLPVYKQVAEAHNLLYTRVFFKPRGVLREQTNSCLVLGTLLLSPHLMLSGQGKDSMSPILHRVKLRFREVR